MDVIGLIEYNTDNDYINDIVPPVQMLEEKAVVYQECSKHFSAHVQEKGLHFPMNISKFFCLGLVFLVNR